MCGKQKKLDLIKKIIFNVLKTLDVFDSAKQLKINWITKCKRDVQVDYIDLSGLSPQDSASSLAKRYSNEILADLPTSYDERVEAAYYRLKELDNRLAE